MSPLALGRGLKVFILGTLSTLVGSGLLTFSDLLLLGFRDVLVLGICLWVAARESWSEFQRMKPLWTGKLATTGQFVYLVALAHKIEAVGPGTRYPDRAAIRGR